MVSCTTLSISVRGKIVLHNARAPSLPPTTSVIIKRRVGVFTLSRVVCCIVVRTPAATENMHFSGGGPPNSASGRQQTRPHHARNLGSGMDYGGIWYAELYAIHLQQEGVLHTATVFRLSVFACAFAVFFFGCVGSMAICCSEFQGHPG